LKGLRQPEKVFRPKFGADGDSADPVGRQMIENIDFSTRLRPLLAIFQVKMALP
jgi:hypothetical protein